MSSMITTKLTLERPRLSKRHHLIKRNTPTCDVINVGPSVGCQGMGARGVLMEVFVKAISVHP